MTGTTRDDRGAVTTFVTVFTMAIVFMFGLVYDGGRLLAAQRQADNEAAAAARAAAQAIDEDAIRATPSVYRLDPGLANNLVCDYFAQIDRPCEPDDYDIDVADNQVTVRVRINVDLRVLPGANRTLEGQSTACNELGLTSQNRIVVCDP